VISVIVQDVCRIGASLYYIAGLFGTLIFSAGNPQKIHVGLSSNNSGQSNKELRHKPKTHPGGALSCQRMLAFWSSLQSSDV